MSSNIVHQYFKKEHAGIKILVKVNPIHFKGTEITVYQNAQVESRELTFDGHIFEDPDADGFAATSPLEFNLYLAGLA